MVKDGKVVAVKQMGEDPRAKSVARNFLWSGGDLNWGRLLGHTDGNHRKDESGYFTDRCFPKNVNLDSLIRNTR